MSRRMTGVRLPFCTVVIPRGFRLPVMVMSRLPRRVSGRQLRDVPVPCGRRPSPDAGLFETFRSDAGSGSKRHGTLQDEIDGPPGMACRH